MISGTIKSPEDWKKWVKDRANAPTKLWLHFTFRGSSDAGTKGYAHRWCFYVMLGRTEVGGRTGSDHFKLYDLLWSEPAKGIDLSCHRCIYCESTMLHGPSEAGLKIAVGAAKPPMGTLTSAEDGGPIWKLKPHEWNKRQGGR